MTKQPPKTQKIIERALISRYLGRSNLIDFTKYTFPEYQDTPAHLEYSKILTLFAKGKIKKLIISMGPQSGKSELSTRRLPAFLLGRDPDLKIAIASYNATFAKKFNREIQRIISSKKYGNLFPNTMLSQKKTDGYIKNADEFEVIGKKGNLKSVGREGPLSGYPVDIMIMDDLYKDYAEGNSPIIRQAVIDWYTSVVRYRLHNDSQELIVFTRWHEEDLVGFLEKEEKVIDLKYKKQLKKLQTDVWYKINFPSISTKESVKNEFDYRKKTKQPLWPAKHSLKKLEKDRSLDKEKFESLHQGDPAPRVGLLYDGFAIYIQVPDFKGNKCYIDVADKGSDYLCCIFYRVGVDNLIYVYDVYYTQDEQKITEEKTAEFLNRNKKGLSGISVDVESNSGGEGFARNVDRLSGYQHIFNAFHQSNNKESRIITNSAEVQRRILFPINWTERWPEFARDLLRFKRNFKSNQHDDCADAITGVLEKSGVVQRALSGMWE